MKPYTWLLFDADNTLFDFDLAEVKALAYSFAEFGFPYDENTGQTYRTINKQIWHELEQGLITSSELRTARFARLFTAVHIHADPEPFSAAYLRHLSHCSDLLDGAETTIHQLSQQYQLAIITNGLSDVQRPRLAGSPLHPYFQHITISDEIGCAKPDPCIFDVAFAAIGHPAKQHVLMIGDSLTSDIHGGHNYGLDTCWYNPQGQPHNGLPITYEIAHLTELLTIL
jgi:2-haloacid dehalogenase